MKRYLLSLCCLCLSLSTTLASSILIGGTAYPIDTTMNYQAGPGVQHVRYTINMNGIKHNCYILEIDMTNPYNHVEEYSSKRQMGGHETLATSHALLDAPNHRTIGAVNCNFWIAGGTEIAGFEGLLGHVFAATANDGVLISQPDDWDLGAGDRGFVMIDDQKNVYIEDMTFAATITTADNQSYTIREMNRPRWYPYADEISIFNHYMGNQPTRATDGVELVFTTNEWNINGDMTCTVHSFNNTGGTVIPEGMGTLQGRGTGKAFLEKLQIGDTFTLHLGIVSTHDATFRPNIMEMVTGNCLVMRNGELTYRNTNEDYNSRVYPRTMLATNDEGNRLWMMVAEKPGFTTAQMCEILRHGGATMAAGMDGGGSAQMFMDGQVINPTTEGAPRKLPNSLWVFSTAPDDSLVTRIETETTAISLPRYGVFKPLFRSYNQYGVLLSHAQEGVQLSCDEAVGYISPRGEFVCLGSGTLTATCQNATYTFQVEAQPISAIAIRLDSVIVMDDTHYPIEVLATAEEATLPISPSALTWTIADPAICQVSPEGELSGLTNGKTWIYGTIDGVTDSMMVKVEIPATRPLLWNSFTGTDANAWTVKGSSSKWNTALVTNTVGTPEISFTYSATRAANVKLTTEIPFYGTPDYLTMPFSLTPGLLLKDVQLSLQANNSTTPKSYKFTDVGAGENNLIVDLHAVLEDNNDIAIYPIQLVSMQFNLNTSELTEGNNYTIYLGGMWLHYGNISVGVDNVQTTHLCVYPNPASNQLHISGVDQITNVTLYDMQGRIIATATLTTDGVLPISHLNSGNYILQVGNETIKIIKQ